MCVNRDLAAIKTKTTPPLGKSKKAPQKSIATPPERLPSITQVTARKPRAASAGVTAAVVALDNSDSENDAHPNMQGTIAAAPVVSRAAKFTEEVAERITAQR